MNRTKLIISNALVALLLWPARTLAATIIPEPITGLPGNSSSKFSFELTNYLQTFLGIVGLVAVAYLIFGGFRYITSGGNEETAEQGKKIIQNSIIGLVIIILSYIIVVAVSNALIHNEA